MKLTKTILPICLSLLISGCAQNKQEIEKDLNYYQENAILLARIDIKVDSGYTYSYALVKEENVYEAVDVDFNSCHFYDINHQEITTYTFDLYEQFKVYTEDKTISEYQVIHAKYAFVDGNEERLKKARSSAVKCKREDTTITAGETQIVASYVMFNSDNSQEIVNINFDNSRFYDLSNHLLDSYTFEIDEEFSISKYTSLYTYPEQIIPTYVFVNK